MIKSKNPFQHTTPHTGGTTGASAVARRRRVGSQPRDTIKTLKFVATQFLTHVLINFQKNPKIAKKH